MRKKYIRILYPVIALLVFSMIICLERFGVIRTSTKTSSPDLTMTGFSDALSVSPECILLTSSKADSTDQSSLSEMEFVLDNMKVSYEVYDVDDGSYVTELQKFKKAVITVQDWDFLGTGITSLQTWVNHGGSVMNCVQPERTDNFKGMIQTIGIASISDDMTSVNALKPSAGFMVGADGDTSFSIGDGDENPGDVFYEVALDNESIVHVGTDDGHTQFLWERSQGSGKYVILNDPMEVRHNRGFLCAAYTCMSEDYLWPVIDASSYYLDDFPSPVPGGDSEYITRDYGVDTATFYSNIWWPQQLVWENKYGIKHTGLIIEKYSDTVASPFDRTEDTTQFTTFGNMLLNNGGELGFHGYNHQPLCLSGTDDDMQYGTYKLWPSETDMETSLKELNSFSAELFPNTNFTVYVPPSNICSDTGRDAIQNALPGIMVLASSYLEDATGKTYTQEFGIDDNGMITTPRIVSGCDVDDYQKLTELSELNFQFVQSHFMHPDDCLDADRGAAEGWATLASKFTSYLDWIHTSAPQLKESTGSEMGEAVLKYTKLNLDRSETDDALTVNIGGFRNDCSFFLRMSSQQPGKTEGCTVEQVTDDLYLVHATSSSIKIYKTNK